MTDSARTRRTASDRPTLDRTAPPAVPGEGPPVALPAYLDQLLLALRVRDVPGPRIAEALAEVRSHVHESGEDPQEAFGPAKEYAEQLTAALGSEVPSARGLRVVMALLLSFGLCASGTWLLLQGVLSRLGDDPPPLGLPPAALVALGAAVLAVPFLGPIRQLLRGSDVLDPVTNSDLTAPMPRWVLPVMLLAPLLSIGLAVVVLVVTG